MTGPDSSFAEDHFALFGLTPQYAVDRAVLDRHYRDLQNRTHPDKHAHGSDAEKRVALQWATRINEAYQVLRDPVRRAQYLLQQAGHDPEIERNTAMPMAFLMEQMALREAVEDARSAGDIPALDDLMRRLRKAVSSQHQALEQALDRDQDWSAAADLVRQLLFQQKLLQEIDQAIESLETS